MRNMLPDPSHEAFKSKELSPRPLKENAALESETRSSTDEFRFAGVDWTQIVVGGERLKWKVTHR